MAKKIILAIALLAILLGAAWAGTAWHAGQRVETELKADIARSIKHPLIKVMEHTHDRGVLSSTGKVVIGLDPKCAAMFDQAVAAGNPSAAASAASIAPANWLLVYHYTVTHGPTPTSWQAARVDGRMEFDGSLKPLLAKAGIPALLATHSTQMKFDGTAQSDIDFPAWQIQTADGATLKWQGLHGTSRSSAGLPKKVNLQLDGKGIEVVHPATRLNFGDMHLKGDIEYTDPRLATGTVDATLSHITAINPAGGPPMFEVKALRMYSNTKAGADQLLDMEVGFLASEGGGMGMQFKNARYELAFRRLHGETLLALDDMMSQRFGCGVPDPARTAEDLQAMGKLMVQLLAHNPQFELKSLGAETTMGTFNLAGRITARDIKEADFATPAVLKNKIDVEARVEIPASLLQSAPMAEALLMEGLLTLDAHSVKTALNYSQGVLMLNGKVAEPDRFMMAQAPPEPPEPGPAFGPPPAQGPGGRAGPR